MKAVEQLNSTILVCSHCPKEFRYNSERRRHELSHFPHFECENCSKKFSFISALRRHQKQHERTGSVKCEECNGKFRDGALLKRHIKYAHKGTFICEKCNHKFSSDLALRTHMNTHKPESERRFKCSHEGCTKSFNFSHHLKHHVLTHTNAKQHYCSFCGKGFIQSHHLKTHLKAHDPAGWLYCEASGCKKKFTTDYARKRHMATHKSKPDSGISSDSNSCETSIPSKDVAIKKQESFLCATCGETVSQNNYKTHSAKCITEEFYIKINKKENRMDDLDNTIEWPNSPFKPSAVKQKRDAGDCNMLLSGCIVNSEICVQKATPVQENYNFTSIENNNNIENFKNDNNAKVKVSINNITANLQYTENYNITGDHKSTIVKVSCLTDYNQNNQKDMCEGCECANICNNKISMYDLTPEESPIDGSPKIAKIDNSAPNIEYRTDGVIKIKDTFDDDIALKREDDSKRFIPFRTCKDVIGNCLVSGGDGCLCARMMADEDQAIMAQEIDDITPQPKTELI